MAADETVPEPEIQYHDLQHQGETAELGIWVFLATEVLFFGGMFLCYLVYRSRYPIAFVEASKGARFVIGTANTALLMTSSLTMARAVQVAGTRSRRALVILLVVTAALGAMFLALKGYEYNLDLIDRDFPGLDFAMNRPYAPEMELFWFLYYMMTGIHAIHLTIGIVLVLIFAVRAHRGEFTHYGKPVEILGYYWSFIDIIWIILYALIYLPGRAAQ